MESARIGQRPAGTLALTEKQVRLFHNRGYLRLDRLTTSEEIEGLRGIYDRLFDATDIEDRDRYELAGDSNGKPMLPQIINPEHYAPDLLETLAYRNALAVARRLLGDDVKPAGMHAIRKPPRDGAETPWHQDEAYWDPAVAHRAVSVWMPLQPATLENGCMHFVPGSHLLDVQTHRLVNPDSHGLVLADTEAPRTAVPCPLPPGGATVHTSRTLHYAGPNRTDQPRRALIMAFAGEPAPLDAPREFPWQRPEWSQEH
jgi:hypothetical protein